MRNVVLICLDTVRKDFFDSNNKELESLIDIDISQCRASSAWSTPSHASMLTGELPHQHGIHTYQRSFSKISTEQTFISDLPDHSILGASANTFAGQPFGFDKFFNGFTQLYAPSQRFLDGINPVPYNKNSSSIAGYSQFLIDSVKSENISHSLSNGFAGLIRKFSEGMPINGMFDDGAQPLLSEAESMVQDAKEPYFLFVNLMDAHLPLKSHRHLRNHCVPASWSTATYDQWNYMNNRDDYQEYWEFREDLYASAIDYLCRTVNSFIQTVLEISSQPVSFIITSDHGENLGLPEEDGLVNHTSSLSEGLLHVPLSIINPPSFISSPDGRIVSHLDLSKLILSMANESTFEWSACPKAEVMGIGPNPKPPSNKEFWDRTIRCTYENGKKYEWDSQGNQSVFEIKQNRLNWQKRITEPVELPQKVLNRFEKDIYSAREEAIRNQQRISISESTENRLEELGYM